MPRLFISAKISEEARSEVARLQERLRKENQRLKITWVNPEVMHLTLHFLGDVEEGKIEEIKETMRNSVRDGTGQARSLRPKLTLESLDAFPNPREPRVIIIHTKDEGNRLAETQKRFGRELAKIRLAINPRPFKPHLTLGRVKTQSSRLQGLESPVAPVSWEVKSVELMESRLTSAGPIYKEVFFLPLSGGVRGGLV